VPVSNLRFGRGATRRRTAGQAQTKRSSHNLAPARNANFGGEPLPGSIKRLKIHYRINGQVGEASIAENALILLPMPKQSG
jgi:hypothetical protein